MAILCTTGEGREIVVAKIPRGDDFAGAFQIGMVNINAVIGHGNYHRSRSPGNIPSPFHVDMGICRQIPTAPVVQIPLLGVIAIPRSMEWLGGDQDVGFR